jgi:hypothetical protein
MYLKWVLQGKKLERKKIVVEYLAFQGGELLPLTVVYTLHYAVYRYPHPVTSGGWSMTST